MVLHVHGSSAVIVIGPVMAGTPDPRNDVFFPAPPPGLLKIPIFAFPVSWTSDMIRSRLRQAFRTAMDRRGRTNGRTVLHLAFRSLRLADPVHDLLVVADSEFTSFVQDLRTTVMRVHFPENNVDYTAGTVIREAQNFLTLLPTVHSV
jgi:hypothetical protein